MKNILKFYRNSKQTLRIPHKILEILIKFVWNSKKFYYLIETYKNILKFHKNLSKFLKSCWNFKTLKILLKMLLKFLLKLQKFIELFENLLTNLWEEFLKLQNVFEIFLKIVRYSRKNNKTLLKHFKILREVLEFRKIIPEISLKFLQNAIKFH